MDGSKTVHHRFVSWAGFKGIGMNVQVITDPFGRILWASPALPGAVHDIRAARTHGVTEALASAGVRLLGGQRGTRLRRHRPVPCRGRWKRLPRSQKTVNHAHAKIRAISERAMPTLKNRRLLRKLQCGTTRTVQAVPTTQLNTPL
ncbi:transposase family protein [Streptomyces murinus]|uniref:transposase family protein n=1 Tax=Streptomyces murinus TaxID=33900 RepID=UPI003820F966